MAIGLGVIVCTYRDYGSNWDEAVQARYGELAVDYFRSGLADTRCDRFENLRYYGPLVEMIPALIYGRAGTGKYELRHLFIALIGLLTLAAVFLYTHRGETPGLPVFAMLALITMPRFYGDWFNNSKDIPFACAVVWTMYALAGLLLRPFAWSRIVACGVAIGLTLCVRPGGLPLLAVYFVAAASAAFLCAAREPAARFDRRSVVAVVVQGVCIFTIAWGIMVVPWPWAHVNPITNPLRAMRMAASFTDPVVVLFEGVALQSTAVPRYYLAKFLLITMPPAVLVLCLVGIVTGAMNRRRAAPQSFLFWLTLLWLALPLALFVIVRPNVYDGIRHFLFVLPAVAILAAFGATWLCERLGGRRRHLAMAACTAVLLLPIKDLVALHPYETTYFNFLVGGVAGASGRYDTEYWLTSYKEAIAWVNQQAAQHPSAPVTVAVAGDRYIAPWVNYYAAANVRARIVTVRRRALTLPDGIDYYIATTRDGLDHRYSRAPIVHTIGREGAVFTVIKGRSVAQ